MGLASGEFPYHLIPLWFWVMKFNILDTWHMPRYYWKIPDPSGNNFCSSGTTLPKNFYVLLRMHHSCNWVQRPVSTIAETATYAFVGVFNALVHVQSQSFSPADLQTCWFRQPCLRNDLHHRKLLFAILPVSSLNILLPMLSVFSSLLVSGVVFQGSSGSLTSPKKAFWNSRTYVPLSSPCSVHH